MKVLSSADAARLAVRSAGLDPALFGPTSVEVVASLLRRAASVLSPCPPSGLTDVVTETLFFVAADKTELREVVDETLSAIVAAGDLVECQVTQPGAAPSPLLLYVSPPSFIATPSKKVFLLGVAPDQPLPLPESLSARIQHVRHLRSIAPEQGENVAKLLEELGFIEVGIEQWLKAPRAEGADEYTRRFDRALDQAPPSGHLEDLRILDTERPVNFYRGRWVEPKRHSGRFVARRKQRYGADLWCYLEMNNGEAQRFVDLPMIERRWRACDEAWRLQAAIDTKFGRPQRCRVQPCEAGLESLSFFSPIPLWAERRLELFCDPLEPKHCLIKYRIPADATNVELRFLQEHLWIQREIE